MVYFLEKIDLKDKIHPFTGKEYSEDSTIFILEENDSSDMVCCQNDNGIYTVRLGLGNKNWKMKAGDFISYADAEELDAVMCIAAQRLCEVREAYAGHVYNDRKLRGYEPNVLVHSTTYERGKMILKDGCLKSWNCLKREDRIGEEYPIGRNLGDPEYFSDYIMFSRGEVSSEIVVMSKQAGEILVDVNHEYKTGMRFYFDAEKMAQDGVLIRDGVHVKVKEKLPLDKYLAWCGDWRSAGLESQFSTPLEFTNRANEIFEKKNK